MNMFYFSNKKTKTLKIRRKYLTRKKYTTIYKGIIVH